VEITDKKPNDASAVPADGTIAAYSCAVTSARPADEQLATAYATSRVR